MYPILGPSPLPVFHKISLNRQALSMDLEEVENTFILGNGEKLSMCTHMLVHSQKLLEYNFKRSNAITLLRSARTTSF